MASEWVLLAVFIGLFAAWQLFTPVLAFVLGPRIARLALAAQPDEIHLEPADESAWSDAETRDRLAREISALGFSAAGGFTVRELPGVKLQLFVHGAESTYAVLYEHPQAGTWFDFACRFTDGSSCTWTTLRSTGLAARPGHPVRNLPNATVATLWKCVVRERPAKPAQPASVSGAVEVFERAWAESTAWRKGKGISRAEVASAAMRKAA